MNLFTSIKNLIIRLYIVTMECITSVTFNAGSMFGLNMTSAKFWRLLNKMWEHCFDMRVKYKFFKDEDA
jgi:hypothetical protein